MQATDNPDKPQLIAQWVNLYSDELYRWAIYKVTDEAVAQDLIQETFLSAFQHADKFQGSSSPKTWLFSILKNKIIDHYRQKVRSFASTNLAHTEPENDPWFDSDHRWKDASKPEPWDVGTENLLDNPEFEATLGNCLRKLPVAWSSCIQLKYLNEKDSDEICQELNITTSNLWQILHRAKLHLRNCLELNWFKP